MRNSVLQNVVWKEGKYFDAQCLNVDVSSFGISRQDALANLDEALKLYFEVVPRKKIQKIDSPEIVPISVKYAKTIFIFLYLKNN